MTISRKTIIETRLQEAFSPSYLEVLDESDQHVGHAGHQGGARHFAVVIKAAAFAKISRLEAHREIYAIFDDMMPAEIHALKITVL